MRFGINHNYIMSLSPSCNLESHSMNLIKEGEVWNNSHFIFRQKFTHKAE